MQKEQATQLTQPDTMEGQAYAATKEEEPTESSERKEESRRSTLSAIG